MEMTSQCQLRYNEDIPRSGLNLALNIFLCKNSSAIQASSHFKAVSVSKAVNIRITLNLTVWKPKLDSLPYSHYFMQIKM